jgi:hypothetical protein
VTTDTDDIYDSPALFIPMFPAFEGSREAEFHRYFDLVHVPERLELPEFRAAERYTLDERFASPLPAGSSGPPKHLNVYAVNGTGAVNGSPYRAQIARDSPGNRFRASLGPIAHTKTLWVLRETSSWAQTAYTARQGPRVLHLWAHAAARENAELDDAALNSAPARFATVDGVLGIRSYLGMTIEEDSGTQPVPFSVLTAFWLHSAEAVTAAPFVEAFNEAASILEQTSVPIAWYGTYLQRPSPWTLFPRPL